MLLPHKRTVSRSQKANASLSLEPLEARMMLSATSLVSEAALVDSVAPVDGGTPYESSQLSAASFWVTDSTFQARIDVDNGITSEDVEFSVG